MKELNVIIIIIISSCFGMDKPELKLTLHLFLQLANLSLLLLVGFSQRGVLHLKLKKEHVSK